MAAFPGSGIHHQCVAGNAMGQIIPPVSKTQDVMDLVVDLLVQVLRWLVVRLRLPAATPHDVVEWRTFRGREVLIGLTQSRPPVSPRTSHV